MFNANGSFRWGRAIVILAVLIVAVPAFFSYTGLASRWFTQPAQIFSPENVRAQWQFAYGYQESLRAGARQICDAQKDVNRVYGNEGSTTTQRETVDATLSAYKSNYNRIQGEYDTKLRNAFEAKLVAPNDVWRTSPTYHDIYKIPVESGGVSCDVTVQ